MQKKMIKQVLIGAGIVAGAVILWRIIAAVASTKAISALKGAELASASSAAKPANTGGPASQVATPVVPVIPIGIAPIDTGGAPQVDIPINPGSGNLVMAGTL